MDISLSLMENRLLVSGRVRGYPDLDVSEGQFYPVENYPYQTSETDFVSIYGLENGLELNGQYFFDTGSETYRNEVHLNGNNLIRSFSGLSTSRLYGYNHTELVNITNIPRYNDSSFNSNYMGMVSYNIDLAEFPSNTPPIVSDAYGKYAFSNVETNIQLNVSDQDGDTLTYTIIDAPTNGTAIITETQGGGVLTYTSNSGFTGTETFTYKANDGTSDSNVAQVSIEVIEKDSSLNWATYFASSDYHGHSQTIKDSEGNLYAVGSFYDFSNFKDNTTLNAVYSNGDKDGFYAKYNEDGELLWANTFGGLHHDQADDVKIASDGNIIVSGRIEKNASFADGEELGDINSSFDMWYNVILKLDTQTGDIIWKKYTGYGVEWDYRMSDNNTILIKSDGTIVSVINDMAWNNEDRVVILEVNSSDGSFNLVSENTENNYSFRSTYDVTLDSNDNIYMIGRYYDIWSGGNQEEEAIVRKYDTNYNIDWEFRLNGSNQDYGNSLVYDPVNNLIYISGRVLGSDLNPLGESYIPSYGDDRGDFFAAYNTDGILQSAHVFANSSQNRAMDISLNLMENRLLVSGRVRGYPDLDVTEGQFYPVENYPYQTSETDFVSIYGLENGLELNG